MKPALIHKIIPHSIVDGPGNRTSIFVQGCNLKCAYCHNPETQQVCSNCGICVEKCPTGSLYFENGEVLWEEEKCDSCGSCIQHCPYHSSPKPKWMTAEEVFKEVEKNIPFIRGITVSGGECTLYPEFLQELFILAQKAQLSCLIDSNGTTDLSQYPKLMEVCSGVMLDVKAWDRKKFKRLTGGENEMVKKNLKFLAHTNKLEEMRIVCIPGEVDVEDILEGIKTTIGDKSRNIKLKLIKFRNHGVKGRLKNTNSPSDEYMKDIQRKALEMGFQHVNIT
ncbi:YjjW family glycine radical enzyme activase [Irregularibacter muris]|uniref:YjjW family glycine radical enzyme activase n=1 Tax=Irregularibacter muris TaxID=1796619 RepID=A0AAE3HHN2_9FIRM|nr:YjjW family glycine radical enzyme activase [Irregularibacter muris]MCR1899555.1 YjjW family glycine radical enzyme activase [Irregularibacter muris]